jgi:hypothetical protein
LETLLACFCALFYDGMNILTAHVALVAAYVLPP